MDLTCLHVLHKVDKQKSLVYIFQCVYRSSPRVGMGWWKALPCFCLLSPTPTVITFSFFFFVLHMPRCKRLKWIRVVGWHQRWNVPLICSPFILTPEILWGREGDAKLTFRQNTNASTDIANLWTWTHKRQKSLDKCIALWKIRKYFTSGDNDLQGNSTWTLANIPVFKLAYHLLW